MLRTTVFLLVLALIAPVTFAQESRPVAPAASAPVATVPTFQNEKCPITGNPVSTRFFVETKRGRIYMCSKECTAKIEADPQAAYAKAYPTTKKLGNKACPITDEALEDKQDTITLQGYEIRLCCPGCAKRARENSQVILALLTNPKVVDAGNATCPITGKPVQNDAFCLIGDDLVHLSSPDQVDAVMKDPKKALEKAKEIKATQKKGLDKGCCDDGQKK